MRASSEGLAKGICIKAALILILQGGEDEEMQGLKLFPRSGEQSWEINPPPVGSLLKPSHF